MRNSGRFRVISTRLKGVAFPSVAAISVFLAYPAMTTPGDAVFRASAFPDNQWLQNSEPGVTRFPVSARPLAATKPASSLSRPERINRALKGDRLITTSPRSLPRPFSAGSLFQKHSALEPAGLPENYELAFVMAKPANEAFQIATAFSFKTKVPKKLQPAKDLPVMVASLVRQSADNIVLSYADEGPKIMRSPFAAVLNDNAPMNILPKLGAKDHDWAKKPLPASVFSAPEQKCLTAGIYFEARSEPVKGQAAVAQVILNRVKNPTYPNSICAVVYQNKHWRNRCQFSFACDRIRDRVRDRERWNVAKYVARETTHNRIWLKEVGSSTHYHATYVRPKWARTMKRVGRIGLHIFYRTYGGGWS